MERKQTSNTDHPATPAPSPGPSTAQPPAKPPLPAETPAGSAKPQKPVEIGGPSGPEPTRYGDWERNGRVSDF
jgi:homeobox protein ESX1